jgi:molecular chaperone DnaJ
VARNATEAELKKAYRRMAMKFHPDRNPNDREAEEKFKEAKEACEALTDPQKRAIYDQYGHDGLAARGGGSAGGFSASDAFADIFGDVFGDIFGGGRRGGGRQVYRGADLRYELELDLEQAVFGHTAAVEFTTLVECEPCNGSGAAPGSRPVTCETCNGVGQVRMQQGFFAVQQTCPTCHGSGKVIAEPCAICHGEGRIKKNKVLEVNIPAGIDEGQRIRLAGKGEPGMNGGPPGDLYVEIRIKPHEVFQRDGDDLHCEVPVSMVTAALGGDLEVATLTEKVSISIPEGTQSGKTFRLRGKGIKGVRSNYPGDLYCHVNVETPVRLTDKQKKLLREFETALHEGGSKHSPQTKGFMDKMKGFFTAE